jgi:hypothetical protein
MLVYELQVLNPSPCAPQISIDWSVSHAGAMKVAEELVAGDVC